MNPFDIIVNIYRFIMHTAIGEVIKLTMAVWVIAAQLLIVWTIIALFLPNINFLDHMYWLFDKVIITPGAFLFYFFGDLAETIRLMSPEGMNPLERTIKFIGMGVFTFISLAITPAFWFGSLLAGYFGFITLLSEKMQQSIVGSSSPSVGSNLKYILMGVVTINQQLEARVLANEINKK